LLVYDELDEVKLSSFLFLLRLVEAMLLDLLITPLPWVVDIYWLSILSILLVSVVLGRSKEIFGAEICGTVAVTGL
jgi:hypothetical protein